MVRPPPLVEANSMQCLPLECETKERLWPFHHVWLPADTFKIYKIYGSSRFMMIRGGHGLLLLCCVGGAFSASLGRWLFRLTVLVRSTSKGFRV